MRFLEEMIYEGNLILVNAMHGLHEEYTGPLVPTDQKDPSILVRNCLKQAYVSTMQAIHAKDRIVPVSGFRPHQEQIDLFASSLQENGEDFTYRYVALPGHSEHETGLALDVGIYSDHIDFIRPDFPYTGISQIFRETAPFFGLIERYGAAKESITGISHEPWHFRYVGYPHAVFMNEKQLCLEEYTDLLHTFTIDHPLYVENHTIFFHPYDQQLNLPERIGYEVSGNNVDGLIITVGDRI